LHHINKMIDWRLFIFRLIVNKISIYEFY
jgi:hypothetical protein